MNDFIKWVIKTSLIAVVWVFILSINVNGRTLFHYANDTLVQNKIISTVDESLADLWYQISTTAKTTFYSLTPQKDA